MKYTPTAQSTACNLFINFFKAMTFIKATAMLGILKMNNLASVKTSTNAKVEMLLVI